MRHVAQPHELSLRESEDLRWGKPMGCGRLMNSLRESEDLRWGAHKPTGPRLTVMVSSSVGRRAPAGAAAERLRVAARFARASALLLLLLLLLA